jgi:ATP adenylyltransferase
MGALPAGLRIEADELERRTCALLKARYEAPIIAFEHGPSAERHGTGCGVDHAHLHLLPLDCDLLSYVRPFVPASLQWKGCDWEDRAKAYRSGLDYLFFRSAGKGDLIAVSEDFGSQVFRRAVSSYLDVENEFNWRTHPKLDTLARTVEDLTGASAIRIGRTGAEHVA